MARPYALHRCHACHAPVTSKRIAGSVVTLDYYAGTRHVCHGNDACAVCGCDRRSHNAEGGFCRVCRAFGETEKARHQFQPAGAA